MKILNENDDQKSTSTSDESVIKDVLPADIVTGQVSERWAQISTLKAMIEELKECYSKSGRVVGILQNLLDAYLVAVGQLELHLHDNNYLGDADEDTPELIDAARLTIKAGEKASEVAEPEKEMPDSEEQDYDLQDAEVDAADLKVSKKKLPDEEDVIMDDFPKPVGDKLTDEDLYNY